jgi:hypothetical protein
MIIVFLGQWLGLLALGTGKDTQKFSVGARPIHQHQVMDTYVLITCFLYLQHVFDI